MKLGDEKVVQCVEQGTNRLCKRNCLPRTVPVKKKKMESEARDRNQVHAHQIWVITLSAKPLKKKGGKGEKSLSSPVFFELLLKIFKLVQNYEKPKIQNHYILLLFQAIFFFGH